SEKIASPTMNAGIKILEINRVTYKIVMFMVVKQMPMSTVEIRAEIQSYLERVQDESFLKVVHSMLGTYVQEQEDPIIGYDVEGNPKRASVMKRVYAEEIRAAREEGAFITLEDLEKEMETW
ncbi:MAG: hypothetical protein AAGJ82_11190, partial [Bacteroidota bacterium]